jgi:Ca-activated chloride channel homolog
MARKVVFPVFLLICSFFATNARGAEAPVKTLAPYFWVAAEYSTADPFPLKKTEARVRINGVIAEVIISQTYGNRSQGPINARYIFPAGTRAALHGMTITIGEAVVNARIRERQAARREFNAAKSEGKSAGLLEQQRPNVFSMDVANILPGDVVTVTLRYTELLVPTEGTYGFVFPTVVGARYGGSPEHPVTETENAGWIQNPYLKQGQSPTNEFDLQVALSAGMPISALSCPSHQITTRWDGDSTALIRLAETERFGGNRDFILNYRLSGSQVATGLMLYEGEKENFFMLMVQPPQRVNPEIIPPSEFIFIVDVSGSMHGFPLETAKYLMKNLLEQLRPQDRFNVVLFAGGSEVMAPLSVPATLENRTSAGRLIDSQQGGGGTELLAALKTTMALPRSRESARTVVLITDGYISAERGVFEHIRQNLNNTNLFSFGIGSSVNRYLIEGVARAGRGEPFVVTDRSKALAAAEQFIRYVQHPVLTRIDVVPDGFEAYDMEPSVMPDLFAQRPLVILGKWRGKTKGNIRISAIGAGGPFERKVQVKKSKSREDHQALPYLWARERLLQLSDYADDRNHNEHKDEITALGLKYNLATDFTSFIAVLEKPRQPQGAASDVLQPLPLPLGVSNLAVGGQMQVGSEPGLVIFLTLTAVLALFVMRRNRRPIRG